MYGRFKGILWIVLTLILLCPGRGNGARIKDIAAIKGIRSNQLFGYGLVIGLNGSGDKGGTGFTIQGLANMLEQMGIHVSPADIKVSNIAAVMVSAVLPPFSRVGKKLDVTVSSIGDAKSLQGGTLLLTPLKGADGKIYALAQGAVSVGGFSVSGAAGGGVTRNHPTAGRVTNGATVEREIPLPLSEKRELTLILDNQDFVTATRIAEAVNSSFGEPMAKPVDAGTIGISIPRRFQDDVVSMVARLEDLEVVPDTSARVLVSEKTGTVVIGENVRISTVAVAHGNLSIEIKETRDVSQPRPFAPEGEGAAGQFDDGTIVAPGGTTVVTPESEVAVEEEVNRLLLVPTSRTIGDLVRALNAIGVSPRDLITILQALKAAGALQADLEII